MLYRLLLVLSVGSLCMAGPARAQVALDGGKSAKCLTPANPSSRSATIRFVNDPNLVSLVSPLCPQTSKLRLSSSAHINAEVTLDCTKWKFVSGRGFTYSAKATGPGSVRTIKYQPGALSIRAAGAGYTPPIVGPVGWVEIRFTVGSTEYCGRFDDLVTNKPGNVTAKGPSVPCQVVCGDGIRDAVELCDDGNRTNGDGCDNNCTPTGCGNGVVTPNTGEQCDGGAGCRANCTLIRCGDGILDPGEQCDDGNTQNGDCCSSTCHFEASGSPCKDDGNECTEDVCNGAGACTHPFEPAGTACTDDGKLCTDDVCDGAGACSHPNNTVACDDGNACTMDDHCSDGVCVGEPIPAWVNEFDYTGLDEFVEISGPTGSDLSGYQVIGVEGNSICGTGLVPGSASVDVALPNGTVLGHDNGSGVGFLAVCFAGSSMSHILAGECDVILPAPSTKNNLKNGASDQSTTCPDGILLLDDQGFLLDAISYEEIVPNLGTFGHFFSPPNPSYNAGTDQGGKAGVSFEKSSSTLMRALSAAEWHLSGGCTTAATTDTACVANSDSPGRENAGQSLTCHPSYSSPGLAFLDPPGSLLD